jgi:hypothetical protein
MDEEQANALEAMRQAVLDHTYILTPHAEEAMQDDLLDIVDVESAVFTGTIERTFTDDPRGDRYEVVGLACDLQTQVGVIVRLPGPMLIVTVYELSP